MRDLTAHTSHAGNQQGIYGIRCRRKILKAEALGQENVSGEITVSLSHCAHILGNALAEKGLHQVILMSNDPDILKSETQAAAAIAMKTWTSCGSWQNCSLAHKY